MSREERERGGDIQKERETEKERGRKKEREGDRERDSGRERKRQREKETEGEREGTEKGDRGRERKRQRERKKERERESVLIMGEATSFGERIYLFLSSPQTTVSSAPNRAFSAVKNIQSSSALKLPAGKLKSLNLKLP